MSDRVDTGRMVAVADLLARQRPRGTYDAEAVEHLRKAADEIDFCHEVLNRTWEICRGIGRQLTHIEDLVDGSAHEGECG